MKHLAIIALSILLFACENQGKKAVNEENQTEEASETQIENISIKGTVMSANDSTPLSMAMILVPGTTIGTMSGPDGNFMINVPEGTKKLDFVMDKYEKKEAEIKAEVKNEVYLTPKEN
jgi:hypothetical protein